MIDAQDRLILWLHYGTELHYKLFARIRETYFYLEEALEDVKRGIFPLSSQYEGRDPAAAEGRLPGWLHGSLLQLDG